MKTNKLTIGILAHVDAGKTTLSESILYQTGRIRKLGRVDHKDAFLDTFDLEKQRGITIFSKQAVFPLGDYTMTLLDTPGHVDFSAEMERTLRVLDYAVLVISGTDGVQGHTLTVWKLLKRYNVPTFIFVNKMDMVGTKQETLMLELKNRVADNCIAFNQNEGSVFQDELALCDEILMEAYLEEGLILDKDIQQAIVRRHVFPVYFGSALKNDGVQALLDGLAKYLKTKAYPDVFGARVFKVSRNQQGDRLTYVKITGGTLKVKNLLTNKHQRNIELSEDEKETLWEEKVDQIRIYSGEAFESVNEVYPGTVCALTGLSMTKPGDGLGFENPGSPPALIPVLSYKVEFPKGTNIYAMLKNLRLLEEEEPHLNVLWNERLSEIHVQVMGEIQIEILKSTILERFDVAVNFDKGSLVYRETIQSSVIGVGHFEPLKHYAEVHLLMTPLEQGKGVVVDANCGEDLFAKHWQRLVISHLKERKHPGVLTGSALTDIQITVIAGKGHNKHTEGGDFRQATFRALRQGLMSAKSVVLEPVYDFTLELPKALLGKGISDIERMQGRYTDPIIEGEQAIIKGVAPVATMMHYSAEVVVYTSGQGRLSLSLKGYEPCHNQEAIVEAIGYDPEKDTDNPVGSVFCSKGSGYSVPWDEAPSHMHVDSGIRLDEKQDKEISSPITDVNRTMTGNYSDQELEAIFVKTYGEQKERLHRDGTSFLESPSKQESVVKKARQGHETIKQTPAKEKYLLVDGYNIVFAWDELKALAADNLDAARFRLMDQLCNYQGQTGETVILVFDAYRVAGNLGDIAAYNNIYVVYTKEAETADQYIEKLVHAIRPDYDVTVATSDVVEQIIILGKGASRLSADALKVEIETVERDYKKHYKGKSLNQKHRPLEKYLKNVSVDKNE